MPRSSPGPAQDWAQGHQLPQPCIQTPSAPPSVSKARSCPPSSRRRVQLVPCSLVLRIRASAAGARVQSLVGEPRSCKPGRAKTKKMCVQREFGGGPLGPSALVESNRTGYKPSLLNRPTVRSAV